MPLTDSEVKNAKPRAKPFKLADGGGMYLQVKPNGAKYWRLKHSFAGKEKLLSLGVYPSASLKEARQKREEAKRFLREGKDPGVERKAAKRAVRLAAVNSFEAVARQYLATLEGVWTPVYAKTVLRRFEKDLFPFIGTRPLAELKRPELLAAVRIIEARGATDMAARAADLCDLTFEYGISTGVCEHNPARSLRKALKPHVKRKQPHVRPEQLPELLSKIDVYDAEFNGNTQTRLGLQLAALIFLRTQELIGAQWTEFDLEKGMWTVPPHRMKLKRAQKESAETVPHIVPLSRQALAILEELKTLAMGSRFVFPGHTWVKPISNMTLLNALYRMGYKGKQSVHGFRHVASTALNGALGPDGKHLFREAAIESQLSHKDKNKIRGTYNGAEYIEERREMLQWWGDHLDRLRGGNVVPLRAA